MTFRIRFAQQIVGIFIILALTLFLSALIFMGFNQRLFSRNYLYRSEFRSAEGLSVGMSIKLRGFEIGKVQSISLNENNRVDVILSIYDTYLDKVRPNSVIELITSPIGLGASLNFFPGYNVEDPLPEQSFIPSADTPLGRAIISQGLADRPEGDEAISRILSEVQPLLASARELVNSMNVTVGILNRDLNQQDVNKVRGVTGEVFRTVSNLQKISSNINQLLEALTPYSQSILENLEKISTNLIATSEGLRDPRGLIPKLLDPKGSIATLLDDKNELYKIILNIMQELNKASREITQFSRLVNQQSPTIISLLEETRTTIRQTQDVLTGLSNNPLLRGGIPERAPQQEMFRSGRDENF
jgi:phospholipid/cholesterol/gamma-HCH transport system substrate-binding protein